MTFVLRPARADESAEIATLFRRVRLEALPYLPVLHTPQDDRNFFTGVLATCRVTVAEADGIVGFIAWQTGWVDHLYIDAPWRGHGIGGAMLGEAKQAEPRLDLWAFQKNLAAIAFYKRHGFAVVRETDGAENEEKEPDVLMRWTRR